MTLYIRFVLYSLFVALLLSSCSSAKFAKHGNNSLIAISVTSTGSGAKGYGIVITMENVETKEIFTSKSISLISSHCVILNIKPGQYIVKKVVVPVGNIKYHNWSDSIRAFFGVINIAPDSKYYLGDFEGTMGKGRTNVLRLKIKSSDIPAKLKEKIEKEETGWKSGEFNKLYPYKKEELLVY